MGRNPSELITRSELPRENPQITVAGLKHVYSAGYRKEAFIRLHQLVYSDAMNLDTSTHTDSKRVRDDNNPASSRAMMAQLKARCYIRLGIWQLSLMNDLESGSTRHPHELKSISTVDYRIAIPKVLEYFRAATTCDDQSYRAWHQYAMMNFRVASHYSTLEGSSTFLNTKKKVDGKAAPDVSTHIVPAIHGFFRALALQRSPESSRQDVLRLLSLWFTHGNDPLVESAFTKGIPTIAIDHWLAVIPQLIARINTRRVAIRRVLHDLLCMIGRVHPQALLYSLTVASKSTGDPSRQAAATAVLNNMREHSSILVDQALTVSHELVRVSVLWHELWYQGIEAASRHWFPQHVHQRDPDRTLGILLPLHAMMEQGPETPTEQSFCELFGRQLYEAHECLKRYQSTQLVAHMTTAWGYYHEIWRAIPRRIPKLHQLEMDHVSPKLVACRGLSLAVPGTYRAHQPVVSIEAFTTAMNVFDSKQHPRKMTLVGNDGRRYPFLLKGHEDLRQDERIMQLFGLINTLLAHDRTTNHADLSIHRYSVIPLSPNSGLIEWAPGTDTLHSVIKQYRDARQILFNIEHRLILEVTPEHDTATIMQKLEGLEHALAHTTGQDLAQSRWLSSPTAEVWLERRNHFTRSLAVMSMVGYILGLGDRHPSNILIDRMSGKIIHIDFGDCFEAAQLRERYPEKVPFRLTRMLVNAMEVSGIEGTYRTTCESVMAVMRKNQSSIMAVLESFVYDPLLSWQLLLQTKRRVLKDTEHTPLSQPSSSSSSSSSLSSSTTTAAAAAAAIAVPLMRNPGVTTSRVVRVGARPDSIIVHASDPPSLAPRSRLPHGDSDGVDDYDYSESKSPIVIGESKDPIEDRPVAPVPTTSVTPALTSTLVAIDDGDDDEPVEALNEKALAILSRVENKLRGKEFLSDAGNPTTLDVPAQVQQLIVEATSHVNLCQAYVGWCAFW